MLRVLSVVITLEAFKLLDGGHRGVFGYFNSSHTLDLWGECLIRKLFFKLIIGITDGLVEVIFLRAQSPNIGRGQLWPCFYRLLKFGELSLKFVVGCAQ